MIRDNWDDIYYPENIEELIHKDTDEKMVDHIRRANADYLDTLALTYMGVKITYREAFAEIDRYARALQAAGLSKGDMITLCLPNSPETIYYFYACNDIGVTVYLVDPRCTLEKMKICMKDSRSKLFACEMGTYFTKVAGHEAELPADKIVVVSPIFSFENRKGLNVRQKAVKGLFKLKSAVDRMKAPKSPKRWKQKDFLAAGEGYSGEISCTYDPDIPTIIVNTSGTSGESVKGAVHSNKSYNTLVNQVSYLFNQIRRGDTVYGYLPFFSMYGSSTCMHAALTLGAVIDLIPTYTVNKAAKEAVDKRSNVLIGVPALFDRIVDICQEQNVDMSFAKLYVIGGDNMIPSELEQENKIFAAHGMKHNIVYGYGATEVMMISTMSDESRSIVYGSDGIIYPCASVKVVDPDSGAFLNYKEEGEFCVHTPTMMLGYLNKPEDSKTVFMEIDGIRYFKTGDKGYLTETGHLFFTGRYKRLMKRPDGHQVSPIPIENAIAKHPLVVDCAVVGLKRNADSAGVIPTAFIKPRSGATIAEKEVTDIARQSLQTLSGEREMALAYAIVDAIPYTENGKMDYRALESHNFSEDTYYVIDDLITRGYFDGMENIVIVKLNKSK